MTILVTGARGAVARGVIRRLVDAGAEVRAASRSGDVPDLPGNVEVRRVDLGRPETLPAALDGVHKVFLYAEPAGADGFVAAAKAAGVAHVVLLSSSTVTLPGADTNPVAQRHAVVERALAESGIPWTFVRPGGFASNALQWADQIRGSRTAQTAFPDATSAPVHERDMAEVAAIALLRPGHENASYLLSGPESLSQRQQIECIADAIGAPVRVEQVSVAQARAQYLERGLPEPVADALIGFFQAAGDRPTEIYDGVPKVTGRPATGFTEWATDHAADFR